MKIALYQGHFPVGDIEGNLAKILKCAEDAKAKGVDLLFFPELALSGYPPEDLLFQADFKIRIEAAFKTLKAHVPAGICIGVGLPIYQGEHIYNALVMLEQNQVLLEYHKQCLPNFGVFDEARYFTAGRAAQILEFQGKRIGLLICEDLWHDMPIEKLKNKNLDLVVSIHASPFEQGKKRERLKMAEKAVEALKVPLLYVHQVGLQDETIYDGASFYLDPQTGLGVLPQFAETWAELPFYDEPQEINEVYQALCFALKSYVEYHQFPGVLLGLSGGVDSALTLAIAVDALGRDRVHAVLMPSRYTAAMSVEDAKTQAEALGVHYEIIPIESLFQAFLSDLSPYFAKKEWDVTEENIQARLRGMILMALSNKSGKMVVTTTNKSELAVGYGTLYGDMAGGFALLKDVYKTQVYELAETRQDVIPERVLTRAPSAELRENQSDQDSLPDYAILDRILKAYIEDNQTPTGAVAEQVIQMVKRNEYKRKQAPLGPKITSRAFGKDWRMPIMNRF